MSHKPLRVMQYRLTGPTAGLRMLRQVTGLHRWRLRLWLQHADGGEDERTITVDAPCPMSALTPLYDAQLAEMSAGEPTVTAGGADAWLLPPKPTQQRPHARA